MKRSWWCVVVAVALSLLAAPATAQPTGPQDRGFAFEVHLGSRLAAFDTGLVGTLSLNGLDGGFFAGYKFGRFMVGGSLEFARYAHSDGNDNADSSFVFMPGVRIAILRSADQRVELYGEADLGFGHVWYTQSGPDPDGVNLIKFQIGPGVRLWFHTNFAVGALVGLRGEHAFNDDGSDGVTSVFAQFAFTGVF
jgi:hypothetical protein